MATNIKPIYPPLGIQMIGEDGLVNRAWGEFFENCYRYQKPCYKDINLGAISLLPKSGNAPDDVTIAATNIITKAFDGVNTTEELHGTFELQHDYKEQTDITPHLHWYPTTAGAGNVKWQLEYWISQTGKDPITSTSTVVSAATGTAWQKINANFDTISGAGLLYMGAQIHLRLFRDPTDAADTYAADAALATEGIHYVNDLFGSIYVTVK